MLENHYWILFTDKNDINKNLLRFQTIGRYLMTKKKTNLNLKITDYTNFMNFENIIAFESVTTNTLTNN